jgi:hypothetical protein
MNRRALPNERGKPLMIAVFLAGLMALCPDLSWAQTAVPTFECIGLYWKLDDAGGGDAKVRFR